MHFFKHHIGIHIRPNITKAMKILPANDVIKNYLRGRNRAIHSGEKTWLWTHVSWNPFAGYSNINWPRFAQFFPCMAFTRSGVT